MRNPRISTITRATLAWTALVFACFGLPASAEDLYSRESFDALVADHRALRVGDNLTVVVTEITSSTTDARTTADKDGSVSGSAGLHQRQQQAAFNLNETFNGGGTIERSGKLLARLTVVVQSVESDGNLRVKGEQSIIVNGDKQKLFVEGRVRQQDIAADNTVMSSRLSEARISYTGNGVLSEKQRQGLLTRLLSWLRIL
jgi:flagellar L-ring protein precursor FlgH